MIFSKYVLGGGKFPASFIVALRNFLKSKTIDAGTKAAMLALPSETDLGIQLVGQGKKIDPIKLYQQRQRVIRAMAEGLQEDLWKTFETLDKTLSEKASDGVARGKRSLKNLCLAYLNKIIPEDVAPLATAMVSSSENMTDKVAGLDLLIDADAPNKDKMLSWFAKKYASAPPQVMDEWLTAQASARRPDVLKTVRKLTKHKAFNIKNPNRVSALIGAFAGNPFGFHAADGSGYMFVGDVILQLDKLNPMTAARFAKAFLRLKDFEPKRKAKMVAALKKLVKNKLSANVGEAVRKALQNA
jgi:aminopeptidase N